MTISKELLIALFLPIAGIVAIIFLIAHTPTLGHTEMNESPHWTSTVSASVPQSTKKVQSIQSLPPTSRTNPQPRSNSSVVSTTSKNTITISQATTQTQETRTQPILRSSNSSTSETTHQEYEYRTPSSETYFEMNQEEILAQANALDARIAHISLDNTAGISPEQILRRKALANKTMDIFPRDYTDSLRYITINFASKGPRGLGGAHTVIVRSGGLSDEEFVSVFLHELGHIIDLGYLKGSSTNISPFSDAGVAVKADDLSAHYYAFSWSNEKSQHTHSDKQDFVTGYAASDPFEDFAESLTYYVFHGKAFRMLAQNNQTLEAKYNFLKENIFKGKEFDTGTQPVSTIVRSWDATKLPVFLSRYKETDLILLAQ